MLDIIREFIDSYDKKKIIGFGLIVVILSTIALTVIVAQQRQTITQEASRKKRKTVVSQPFPPSSNLSLKLSPSSVSVPVNGSVNFDVFLDTGSNQITGVDFTFNYNGNVVELQESTIGDNKLFNNKLHDTIGTNTYRYSAVTTGSSLPAGETNLGTITFLAKAFGQDTPTFQNAQIAILGNNQTVQANTESSTITVSTPTSTPGAPTATPSSTPTPTAILLPTSTPLPTFTPTPIPSLAGDANGDNSVDILDFNIWRTEFLNEGQTKKSDFNDDGKIDIADFAIWRNAFNPTSPSPTPIATSSSKRIFITSTGYKGNFGGSSVADSKCQEKANAAGLDGQWKAWISDNSSSPISRFNYSDKPYKNLNGDLIANNWNDLVDGNIQKGIVFTERNTVHAGWVWTNTNTFGNLIDNQKNCNNWTSGDSSDSAWMGSGNVVPPGNRWTAESRLSCNNSARFYCFEQ